MATDGEYTVTDSTDDEAILLTSPPPPPPSPSPLDAMPLAEVPTAALRAYVERDRIARELTAQHGPGAAMGTSHASNYMRAQLSHAERDWLVRHCPHERAVLDAELAAALSDERAATADHLESAARGEPVPQHVVMALAEELRRYRNGA